MMCTAPRGLAGGPVAVLSLPPGAACSSAPHCRTSLGHTVSTSCCPSHLSSRGGARNALHTGTSGTLGLTRRQHFSRGNEGRKSLLAVSGLPFAVPEFDASKLSVVFRDNTSDMASCILQKRCYTLTHNDLTGDLFLTIGSSCNLQQICGWYNRLVRDEVIAVWDFGASGGTQAALHVHCHVSGQERWLAPPQLRDYIFRREMQLVLDCFVYADKSLLEVQSDMLNSSVMVHFHSDIQRLNRVEYWGVLGARETWKEIPLNPFESSWAARTKEGPSCTIANHPCTPADHPLAVWPGIEESAERPQAASAAAGPAEGKGEVSLLAAPSTSDGDALTDVTVPWKLGDSLLDQSRLPQGNKSRQVSSKAQRFNGLAASIPRKAAVVPVVASANPRRGRTPP
mmetsp:Transcript_36438/g.102925  ORF Transcript_36438/g.102925 Transcript_36438/m.102925 type:complete len:398 (+) Transcript_36438:352-1545(+)